MQMLLSVDVKFNLSHKKRDRVFENTVLSANGWA
jgi:hypothetical protein